MRASTGLEERVMMLNNANAQNLPMLYLLHNKNLRIQFITELMAQYAGAQSAKELINLTAADFQCEAANYVNDIQHYQRMCIYQRSEVLLLSLISSAKGPQTSLLCYKPIINDKKEIEGIEAWLQLLPSTTNLENLIQDYRKLNVTDVDCSSADEALLTPREHECAYFLAKGYTFIEIAEYFAISPRTVETHVANIKHKLGVKSRAELLIRLCELGYLEINLQDPNSQPNKLQLLEVKPVEIE